MISGLWRVVAAVCFLVLASLPAYAHDMVGDIMVEQAWARASAGLAGNGAAFLILSNEGLAADRLVNVTSPVAEKVELHTHVMEDGVMKMRPVDGIDLAPGGMVELKPGGLHIMLLGLKAPLVDGNTFPVTLTFAKAGALNVDVVIKGVGSMGDMPEHDHQHMHH